MKDFLIIHSVDSTTSFLTPIINSISSASAILHISIVESSQQEEVIRRIVELPYDSTVLFLGHGASHCIYLPLSDEGNKKPLINNSRFDILAGKNFISLSCRSAEFIVNNFNDATRAMVGFDDLPTHWDDVNAEREVNVAAYQGITDNVLTIFRELLVSIVSFSLRDAIKYKMSFHEFYYRLRFYTSCFIAKVNSESLSDNPSMLANILFEFKMGIKLVGNLSALLV